MNGYLRPMRLSEILDQGIRWYRQLFRPLLPIYLAIAIISLILSYLPSMFNVSNYLKNYTQVFENSGSPQEVFAPLGSLYGIAFLTGAINYILNFGFLAAAVAYAVKSLLCGEMPTPRLVFANLGRQWRRILFTVLLLGLLGLVVYIWMIVPCVGWLSGPGAIIFVTLVVIPLVPIIVCFEDCTPDVAIGRAWRLARRRFWWLLGFALLAGLLAGVVSWQINIAFGALSGFITAMRGGSALNMSASSVWINALIYTLTAFVSSLLATPILFFIHTANYLDLRVRTEGLGIQLATSYSTEQRLPAFAFAPLADESTKISLSGSDFGRMTLLGIGIIGLFFILYMLLVGIVFAVITLSNV